MIKANELRIGNKLNFLGDVVTFKNITEIREDGIFWIKTFEPKIESKNFHFKPIEITEEWLLKFGFKNKNGQNRYELKHIGMVLLNDSVCVTMYDAYNEVDNSLVLLNYIHQLQNLYFALVGSELQLLEAEV